MRRIRGRLVARRKALGSSPNRFPIICSRRSETPARRGRIMSIYSGVPTTTQLNAISTTPVYPYGRGDAGRTPTFANIDLNLLHELAPKVATIGVFGDPHQPELDLELRDIEAAGRAIGRQILVVKVDSEREFNASFATILRAGAGALLVRPSPLFLTRRRQLVALAVRHALVASYPSRNYVEAGGLMSYGPDITDAYRRVGIYVGRILKGEKPANLPVEMATKFDLVINLATAKAIDLDIPPMLLARADEVIV